MPRPRIRPEDRQRAVKACLPCKSAKKRCDSRIPCASCVRRGCPLSCLYHDVRQATNTRRSSQISNQSSELYPESVQQYSSTSTYYSGTELRPTISGQLKGNPITETLESQAPISLNSNDESRAEETTEGTVEMIDDSPRYDLRMDDFGTGQTPMETASLPQSRLMLNAKGEKVYVGNAASLAFLQFLRQILSQYMGPSQFTENSRGNVMLEAQTPGEDLLETEHDLQLKRALLDNYFLGVSYLTPPGDKISHSQTSGILDFYSRPEMDEILASVDTERAKATDKAIIYLALAIGGQCRASSSTNSRYTQRHFTQGQKLAFEGMLEDPSIKLVHSFLLMAFYLLGSCRRNAAFMYIGVAARAAHALGLHEADPNYVLSTDEQNSRLRTWKSLRTLDVMVSSILARPFASTSTRPQPCASIMGSRNRGSSKAIDANFELCSIIEDVLYYIGQQTNLDASSTRQLLQRLTHWSLSLPPEIRLSSIKQSIISSEHGLVVGNIHVACLYYFTVMLLTRPFLIQHLMLRLSNLSGQVANSPEGVQALDHGKLAEVCIDAATFMAQICQSALSAGLLLDNMCILKAWIFGAGLVLGFTMFANIEVSLDMENAFAGVRDVLKRFSQSSQQAEHYHSVLSSFSEAIMKRREHIAQERRRATSQYVDQILVMDFQDNQDQQCVTPTPGPEDMDTTRMNSGDIEDWWNLEFPLAEGILDNAPDVLTANWDAFALQISENFTVDADPPEKLIGTL